MKPPLNNDPQTYSGGVPIDSAKPLELVEAKLIKRKQLAKLLSVSVPTIDAWRTKRIIPYIEIRPRFYLFEPDEVVAALKKHYQVDAKTR